VSALSPDTLANMSGSGRRISFATSRPRIPAHERERGRGAAPDHGGDYFKSLITQMYGSLVRFATKPAAVSGTRF
jgi:hypothetical protein